MPSWPCAKQVIEFRWASASCWARRLGIPPVSLKCPETPVEAQEGAAILIPGGKGEFESSFHSHGAASGTKWGKWNKADSASDVPSPARKWNNRSMEAKMQRMVRSAGPVGRAGRQGRSTGHRRKQELRRAFTSCGRGALGPFDHRCRAYGPLDTDDNLTWSGS